MAENTSMGFRKHPEYKEQMKHMSELITQNQTGVDKFVVLGVEAGVGKSRETDKAIARYLNNVMEWDRKFLIVKRFQEDVFESAARINRLCKNHHVAIGITQDEWRQFLKDQDFSQIEMYQVVIITHVRYRSLSQKSQERYRAFFEKGRHTLIIDEQLEVPVLSYNDQTYGDILSCLNYEFKDMLDELCKPLQNELKRLKQDGKSNYLHKAFPIVENRLIREFEEFINAHHFLNDDHKNEVRTFIDFLYNLETATCLYNPDLLITYENYLFIIEIKAGSFPQTPPINDFDAHINAYTKLAQEADSQCSRTLRYIDEHRPAPFYNSDKQKKFEINNISDYKEVYLFSVTVDNFNEFAAKAEKLNFITLSSKTIVISYDDLLAYEKYFDSPIYYLHFLKQRKMAIDIPQIAMNDELDHLGMYISHNMYSITASEFPAEHMVNWHGFRQDLDNYFSRLYLLELNATKPKQDIPNEITEIIQLLEQGTDKNKIDVAHFLLNMSSEAKEDFCRAIHHALRRQPEIGRMLVTSAFGEMKYCLFVAIPSINVMSPTERQDYVLSAIISDESMPVMWIDLDYDKDGKLIGAKGKQCKYSDIPPDEIDRLKELSVEYSKSRIESFQCQYHRKVGRNDPCPCGSGKKYKKCCIQYE